jgi:hypothetical protein
MKGHARKKRTFTCLWCKEPFLTVGQNAVWCCSEHRGFYHHKMKAIERLFPWLENEGKRLEELAKLKVEGSTYQIPEEGETD